jgi:hypothetical protein
MPYKYAVNYVDPATTTDVDPQPRSKGITYGNEVELGDNSVIEDGYASTEWEFTVLTSEQLDSLLAALNLVNYKSYPGTFYTRINKDRTFDSFYGTIVRPDFDGKFEMGLWRGLVFRVNKLQEV